MVLNNSVYAPSLPRNVSDTLCAGDGAYCDLRLKLTLDFLRGALADGPAVPDALWWMDLRDEVACTDVLNDCQVPLLGFFINGAAGWGDGGGGGGVVGSDFSWDAVEPGGGTLLVPAVHDVDHQLYDYPWHLKRDAAFFRGGGYCHGNKFSETEFFGAKVGCSRSFMYALSKFFNGSALLDAAMASEPGPAADGRAPASQPPGFYTVPDHARFKFLLNLEVTRARRASRAPPARQPASSRRWAGARAGRDAVRAAVQADVHQQRGHEGEQSVHRVLLPAIEAVRALPARVRAVGPRRARAADGVRVQTGGTANDRGGFAEVRGHVPVQAGQTAVLERGECSPWPAARPRCRQQFSTRRRFANTSACSRRAPF